MVIAPYWRDVDTRRFGDIYYRLQTNGTDFSKLNEIVATAFDMGDFEIEQIVVATYDQVAQFDGSYNEVSLVDQAEK